MQALALSSAVAQGRLGARGTDLSFVKLRKCYLQQLQRGEAAEHARRQLGDLVAVQHPEERKKTKLVSESLGRCRKSGEWGGGGCGGDNGEQVSKIHAKRTINKTTQRRKCEYMPKTAIMRKDIFVFLFSFLPFVVLFTR